MNINKKTIKKFDQAFYDRMDYIFWEVFNNNFCGYESDESKKYNKICDEIKKENPNLINVLENDVVMELNKKEVKALIKYIKNDNYRRTAQGKELMLITAQETILLLRKLNILKINRD